MHRPCHTALSRPRDIFHMNQGLLYALHFSFDGLNDTILDLFRQLIQKTVLRDQSDLPWVNEEVMCHYYLSAACETYLESLKQIKHDAIRENSILDYASVLDDYLRHLYNRTSHSLTLSHTRTRTRTRTHKHRKQNTPPL